MKKGILLLISCLFFGIGAKAQGPVAGVTLKESTITLVVNEDSSVIASITPANATNKKINFVSSNSAIVEVTSTPNDTVCYIKAKSAGTAKITATSDDSSTIFAVCNITVNPAPVSVTAITLKESAITLVVNKDSSVIASITPANAANKTLHFVSSDPAIVEITSTPNDTVCYIKAKSAGTAKITATSDDSSTIFAECNITVNPAPVSVTAITLKESAITLVVNKDSSVIASITPADAATKKLNFVSSDPTIVEITSTPNDTVCYFKAKSAGTTKITATSTDGSSISAECNITVNPAPIPVSVTGIQFNKTAFNLNVDSVSTLIASFIPSNATNKNVTVTSSDPSIVAITSTPQDTVIKVKALKAGTATITVKTTDGNKTATCSVTVPPVIATKVTLGKDTTLTVGDSVTLKVTITPDNATEKGVTWISLSPTIATVSITDGKVKAIAVGKASIIATSKSDNTKKDTCIVEVSAQVIPVTSVQLSKDSISIIEGDTMSLIASILPANASNKKVSWESKNITIATVNNGLITAIKAGKTSIIVTSENGSKRDTCIVNVREKVILIDPVTTTVGSKGSIPLSLNAPDKETLTGSFTIQFPTGIALDIENTKLTEAFAASSSLSITAGSNNTWKIEIKKKDLKNMLRALSNQKIMDIAYTITASVKKGTLLDFSITNAEFKFTDNTEIKEERMSFKLRTDFTTSNDLIGSDKPYAYAIDNRLFIRSAKAETIYVYTFGGTLLFASEKAEGEVTFNLNVQEPIIVKGSSGWTQKVAK